MINQRKPPCHNCITLPICRSVYTNKYDDYYAYMSFPSYESCSMQARFALIDRCKLIDEWLTIDIRYMSYEDLHATLHKYMYYENTK